MSKDHHSKPHPNSIYSKVMREHDPKKIQAFNRWRREILDDVASFERWGRDGFTSGRHKDHTSNSRDDIASLG